MKKNLLLLTFLCIAVIAFGQKLPFQGKLIESGTPVTDSRDFIFSIPAVGWSETHAGVQITDGLYFVVLGTINPLPDDLFAGVTEQNMDITVGGTVLSPVILFKPLTTPFEGNELQVRNTDGAIVGSLYANNDSVNKNGELELFGTNGNLNLRLSGDGPGNNQGSFSVHDSDGNQKTKLSIVNGTGWYNASGANGGAIVSGFKFWEGQQGAKQPFMALEGSVTPNFGLVWAEVVNRDSSEIGKLNLYSSDQNEDTHIEPAKLFVKKNGATMIELNTQNWGSQEHSGLLWVRGPSSNNIQLTGKNWENPNLPWMKLSGVNNSDAIQLSIENDSTETPYINLNSIGNGHSSFTANSFYQRGPNSTNIEFNPGWWDQPDRAILNMNGNTDENRIQLGIFEDGNQNEHGNMFLTSGNGMRMNIEPQVLSIKNTSDPNNWRDMLNLSTQENVDAGTGWSGKVDVMGPSSSNVHIGSRDWESADLGMIHLFGENDFHALELSVTRDENGHQFGWINLNSENGKNLNLSPEGFGVEGVGMQTHQAADSSNYGYLFTRGPNTTNFETGGDWNSPDRGYINLNGANDQHRFHVGIHEDGDQNEYGSLDMESSNGLLTRIEPNILSLKNIQDPNNWRDMLNLSTQENVDAGTGWSGKVDVMGPSSSNVHIGSRDWESADLGMIHLFGENDFHALELSVTRDENGHQFGWINLNSENGKNLNLSPEGFGVEGVGMQTHQAADSSNYGYLFTRGPNTTNFETGGDWNNPDRAYLNMNGNTDEYRLRFAIYEDGNQNEHGNIEIRSAVNKQAVIEHNNIAFWNTTDPNNWQEVMSLRSEDNGQGGDQGVLHLNSSEEKTMYASPRNIALRDDANGYHHLVDLNTNNDSGNGWAGFFNLRGPNTTNFEVGAHGHNRDLPYLNMNGANDENRISLNVEDNGQGGDQGVMHLNSSEEKSMYANSRNIALRNDANGYHHLVDMNINNDSGNGWAGHFNVRGPNSDNFNMGINGNNPDMPWFGINGERINLMHFTGIPSNDNEFGYMHLQAEDGSTSNISAYRIENSNGAGMTGYFGHDRTEFNDNGQIMTFNAYGISGSSALQIQNGANVVGTLTVNGDTIASNFSDKRFKKNIEAIGVNTLQKIQLIEGVSYDWKREEFPDKYFSSRKQIGVIAQELEAQYPELVNTNADGYKSVNYNGFTAVLLEAVKELSTKVEKLEAENTQLRAELSASAKNTSEIAQLQEQVEALVKLVHLQKDEESSEEQVTTPGLK